MKPARYAGAEDPDHLIRSASRRRPRGRHSHAVLDRLAEAMTDHVQTDLAYRTGYPQSTISSFWLAERASPRFLFVADLADVLGYELRLVPKGGDTPKP